MKNVERPIGFYHDVAIGVLMFVSTLYFASNAVLLGVLILLVFRSGTLKPSADVLLIFVFSLFALVNIFFHLDKFYFSQHASSFAVVLIPIVAILAPRLRVTSLKIFVILTCCEVVVGIYEIYIGQIALTTAQADLTELRMNAESMLLYNMRVLGLSNNSSVLAEKIFLSFLLLSAAPCMFKSRLVPLFFLVVGLVITFNRTAIIASFFLIFLVVVVRKGNLKRLPMILAMGLILGVLFFISFEIIKDQFTRGTGGLTGSELSRFYYWQQGVILLLENPLMGNGSLTFRIIDPATGTLQHAHNSFLSFTATHGVLTSLPFFLYVLLNIRKENWKFIISVFVFSIFQYFIFWNISVSDLILFWLLGSQYFKPMPLQDTGCCIHKTSWYRPTQRPHMILGGYAQNSD